ncbi:MAG: multiheme c-type cytochrome [Planctomycetota bacterium]|jgi:hypothetical protein
MRNPARILRALLLLSLTALLALGAYWLLAGERESVKRPPPVIASTKNANLKLDSAENCKSCHAGPYGQWHNSRHAQAWVNPQLEAYAALTLGIEDCIKCHAPEPVFLTGIGDMPRKRDRDRDTGVDCLTCHLSEKGIVGPSGNPDAPCKPIKDPRLQSSALCAGCHRTVGLDWKESPAKAKGLHCQDCHMKGAGLGAEGAPRRPIHHAPVGGHDLATLKRAFTFKVAVEGEEAVVSITNTGAGHNFPGERHFRILMLWVEVADGGGETREEFRRIIKNVSAIRQARRDADIRAGETLTLRFPLPVPRGAVQARLLYKRYPSVLDHEAIVLADKKVDY